MTTAVLRFDGGAKPGNATAGAVLATEGGLTIAHVGAALGSASNNVAESTALAIGLELALAHGVTHLHAYGDSALVIGQAFKEWGAAGELGEIAARSRRSIQHFEECRATLVPRELNTAPDALCHAIESGWWCAPGMALADGSAMLGFVASLEVEIATVESIPARNALKKSLQREVERAFTLVRDLSVSRTNANPFLQPKKNVAVITYVVRLHVGEVIASDAKRRADVETRLLDIATTIATSRARVARISG